MRISIKQINEKMKDREDRGCRALFWSIREDMKALVTAIQCDFDVDYDRAKKLAFKVVKSLTA